MSHTFNKTDMSINIIYLDLIIGKRQRQKIFDISIFPPSRLVPVLSYTFDLSFQEH